MTNKYLTKLAGLPGAFMSSAMRAARAQTSHHMPQAKISGLSIGPNVVGPKPSITRTPSNPLGAMSPKSGVATTASTAGVGSPSSGARGGSFTKAALLEKVAKLIFNKDKTLPYRERVEVAIFKGDKVLLTRDKDSEKPGEMWYGFPGGGKEGKSFKATAEEEALEEVGIAIKDLKKVPVERTEEGIDDRLDRAKGFRGSKTEYGIAIYDDKDKSLYGHDDDAVKYVWKTKDEAVALLKQNSRDSSSRVEVLEKHWP